MNTPLTGQELLNAATAWYRENGSLPIPKSGLVCHSNVDGSVLYSQDEYRLSSLTTNGYDNSIALVPGCVVPLLAAISLGFNSDALAQIVIDHKIDINEITGMGFNDDLSTGISLHSTPGTFLTPLTITIETVKAFSSSDNIRPNLYRSFSPKPTTRESIAVMHTKERSLWPVAQIEAHAKAIMTPSSNLITSPLVRFGYIVSAPQSVDEIPNASPIDLLHRSGMLCEPVLRKQTGLFEHWEDLVYTAANDHKLQLHLLESLAKVSHQPTLDLAVRGLLSISVDASSDEMQGDEVYRAMEEVLGSSEPFGTVFRSLILKLNLVSSYSDLDVLEEMEGNTDVYGDLLSNQHNLVSRIADELMSRPPEHLGFADYAVFRKLDKMSLPGQTFSFSPEKLMNHILGSMGSHLTTNQVECKNKNHLDLLTMESVCAMAKVLTRHHNFDHSQFQNRNEATKVQLVKGGFDIKQFKGLSYKARGQILEDGMGL